MRFPLPWRILTARRRSFRTQWSFIVTFMSEVINAEELARKYGRDDRQLRAMLRAHPDLTPGHQHGQRYQIDTDAEARIVNHPKFRRSPPQ